MIHFNIKSKSFSCLTKKEIGNIGESIAIEFLKKKGFRLIKRNYTIKGGEIDLIMEKDDIILFVEVKTRRTESFGYPENGLSKAQIKRIIRAIMKWQQEVKIKKTWRCDLVGISLKKRKQATIIHLTNILLI